jgi:hypothetical protein
MMKNRLDFGLVVLLLALASLCVHSQEHTATVKGKITDSGKPLGNVQVVLTNVDNGRKVKTKTDSRGEFATVGLAFGNFKFEVIGTNGEILASRDGVQINEVINVITLDLKDPNSGGGHAGGSSTASPMEDPMSLTGQPSSPKLTKQQIAKIEADNKRIAGLNSLIADVQSARQAQDWPKAENALKQLIAAAPDASRWEFYMYLGEAQSKSNQMQEAAQTLDKGIQIAQSLASGATPPDPRNPQSMPAAAKSGEVRMLTSQANIFLKLQKPDEAIAALKKAVALEPSSALGQYNLCGVEYSAQKYDDAKTACNKYLQLEPSGPHAEEVKTFLAQMPAK